MRLDTGILTNIIEKLKGLNSGHPDATPKVESSSLVATATIK
jgi:hypothetical protein